MRSHPLHSQHKLFNISVRWSSPRLIMVALSQSPAFRQLSAARSPCNHLQSPRWRMDQRGTLWYNFSMTIALDNRASTSSTVPGMDQSWDKHPGQAPGPLLVPSEVRIHHPRNAASPVQTRNTGSQRSGIASTATRICVRGGGG